MAVLVRGMPAIPAPAGPSWLTPLAAWVERVRYACWRACLDLARPAPRVRPARLCRCAALQVVHFGIHAGEWVTTCQSCGGRVDDGATPTEAA